MAEVGLIASLLGISTFGIQLTNTLYKFGSTASSAREQTDYIARHVTLYSDVLELLAQRIDDDEPIHSRKALDLVYGIYDQSCDLFDNIRDLLPDRADKLTFMQKIKWNFKKSKVDLLVSEIEYLKSTVNLLVSVLYAGKKLRTHRRKKESKKTEKDAKAQFARVQNAIVEQANATSVKEHMQAKVEDEDQAPAEAGEASGIDANQKSTAVIKHAPPIVQLVNNTAMIQFRQSLGQAKNPSEERGLVISNSIDLLRNLIDQWTTLAEDSTPAATNDAQPSTRTTNEQTPKEGLKTAPKPADDARDVWKSNYLQSQKRVEELEAELAKMKTAAETKRAPGRSVSGDHDDSDTRPSLRTPSAQASAGPEQRSSKSRKTLDLSELGDMVDQVGGKAQKLGQGGDGAGVRTGQPSASKVGAGGFSFSDPNVAKDTAAQPALNTNNPAQFGDGFGAGGRTFHSSNPGGSFNFSDPNDVFAQFAQLTRGYAGDAGGRTPKSSTGETGGAGLKVGGGAGISTGAGGGFDFSDPNDIFAQFAHGNSGDASRRAPNSSTGGTGGGFNFSDPNDIFAQFARTPSNQGYGNSSSPRTPELREERAPRTASSRQPSKTSTRYQIVDPVSDDDRQPRVTRNYPRYDDDRNRARYRPATESFDRDSLRRSVHERPYPPVERPSERAWNATAAAADGSSPRLRRDSPPISRQPTNSSDSRRYPVKSQDTSRRSRTKDATKPSRGAVLMQDFSDSDMDTDVDTDEGSRRRRRRGPDPWMLY